MYGLSQFGWNLPAAESVVFSKTHLTLLSPADPSLPPLFRRRTVIATREFDLRWDDFQRSSPLYVPV